MVSVVKIPEDQIELLVKSAIRFFLINHDVDFVVFTDIEPTPHIERVNFINIDNSFSNVITYYQFQKILSLNYINLNKYDYVFIHDIDSLYLNEVIDSDLLTNELCILDHFTKFTTKDNIFKWTDIVTINNDTLYHTMGNFWGGPSEIIKNFLEFSNLFWEKNKNYNFNDTGFFSMHSEEVLLMKFIDTYNIKEKRISSSLNYDTPAYLTDFKGNGNLLKNLSNFKLIHDTKYFIDLSHKILDNVF